VITQGWIMQNLFLNVHEAKRNMKLESLQRTGDTTMKYVKSVWLNDIQKHDKNSEL
jgi:hypothetical protein